MTVMTIKCFTSSGVRGSGSALVEGKCGSCIILRIGLQIVIAMQRCYVHFYVTCAEALDDICPSF